MHTWATLNLLHRTRRFIIVIIPKAAHRRHIFILVCFNTGIICGILVGISGDIIYPESAPDGPAERYQLTLNLCLVTLWFSHQQRCGFAIQWIGRVGIAEELGKEDLEYVDHIEHRGPRLVYHIEANGAGPAAGTIRLVLPAGEGRTTRQCWGGKSG
jgi:hypothetical protein